MTPSPAPRQDAGPRQGPHSSLPPLPLSAEVELVTYRQGGHERVGWWDGDPQVVVSPWGGGLPPETPVRRLVATSAGWRPRGMERVKARPPQDLATRVSTIRHQELFGVDPASIAAVFDPSVWQPVIDRQMIELSPRNQSRVQAAMASQWDVWVDTERAEMERARRVADRLGPLNGPAERARNERMKRAIMGMAEDFEKLLSGLR